MREPVHISNFMRKPKEATFRKRLQSAHVQYSTMRNEAFDVDPKELQSFQSAQLKRPSRSWAKEADIICLALS